MKTIHNIKRHECLERNSIKDIKKPHSFLTKLRFSFFAADIHSDPEEMNWKKKKNDYSPLEISKEKSSEKSETHGNNLLQQYIILNMIIILIF